MNAALWTLMGLHFWSYLRFMGRSLTTVKGVVLIGIGALALASYLSLLLFMPTDGTRIDPDQLRLNGPTFMLLYCLLQVVFNSGQNALYFTPAEVQFLFTGPFTRRQILVYKITMMTLLMLPLPLFFALLFRAHAGSWYGAVLGLTLGLLFLSLFTVAVHLLVDTAGASLYSRARWLIAVSVVVVVAVVAFLSGALNEGASEVLATLPRSGLVRAVSWPLSWFFEVFLAQSLDGWFLLSVAMCLLWCFLALWVIFALDHNLLEMSAANTERVFTILQQMRRGQTALSVGGGTAGGWTLPDLPRLGGIGPILWRQLLLALRGLRRLVTLLVVISGFMLVGVFSTPRATGDDASMVLIPSMISLMVMMTILMTNLVPFDYRGDVDNMALLKSLPISPWALTIGQLLAPTLVTTLFHWIALAALGLLAGLRGKPLPPVILVGLALLFPLFNFLMYCIENLLFLLFPVRLTAATPGDFQNMGRQIILMMTRLVVLGVVVGLATALGVLGYFVAGNNWAVALSLAGLVLLVSSVAMVPFIVMAFQRFDVGRDTPP